MSTLLKKYNWIAALWCVSAISVNAQDYFVATNGSDAAAGTSWDAPFLTISNAIAVASPGQTVAVSNGTYLLATQLLLDKGITLQGVGGASNTIIDANYSGRIMIVSNSAAVFDGFTVRNGFLNSSGQYGAGINISAGEVRNCIVMNNTNNLGFTVSNGGGIYMSGGVLSSSIVRNNYLYSSYAACKGGGVYVGGGAVVTNCTILGNLIDGVDPITRGGGVYIDTGSVVDCTIVSNNAAFRWSYTGYGGGVYLAGAGAVLDRSVLSGNQVSRLSGGLTTNGFGGGIAMTNGTVRNCLISGNESANTAGGAFVSGGTLENCTVVRNKGTVNYGGVYWTNTPAIRNDIVYDNIGGVESNIMPVVSGLSQVTYSCAPSLTNGTGNVTADPLFVNPGIGSGLTFTAGDYRPVEGSPCETNGLVSGWMSTALDLAGLSRLNGSEVDMGCYVAIPPSSTYVATTGNDGNAGTNWSAPFLTIQKGIDSATPLGTVSVSNGTYVLTSQLQIGKSCTVTGIGGSENTIIDANASGRIMIISNSTAVVDGFTLKNGKATTANYEGTGIYMGDGLLKNCTIRGCTNTASTAQGVGVYMTAGTVDTCTIENNIGSGGGSGGGLFMAGSDCLVTNCLMSGNQLGTEFASSKGGGAYVGAGRLLGCVVTNNTLNAGRNGFGGGGVYVTGSGIVSNCLVTSNTLSCVDIATRGGGVYVDSGSVLDCVISENTGQSGWGGDKGTYGAGLYMTNAAVVERCIIKGNFQYNHGSVPRYGAGVAADGGIMRNCLIMGNTANTLGGGLYITGGTNENCTIVRNLCSGGNYGGVYWTNSPAIINAIVYNNSGGVESNILAVVGGLSQVTYSCAPSLTNGTGNITGDPLFADPGSGNGTTFTAGDYRPVASSPCETNGLVSGWMSTALDLAGLPRLNGGKVEMGCYVAIPPSSTYVATTGDDGNAGTDWSAPVLTIQKGIDSATTLGTVVVSNGTYVLDTSLLLSKGITVTGSGGASNTVIDANGSGRVITISSASAVLDGFTLRSGYLTGSQNGAGINMSAGEVRNCIVMNNTNDSFIVNGGGVYMTGGILSSTMVRDNFLKPGNSATAKGGGVYVSGGAVVTNCTISGNLIDGDDPHSRGAGVYIDTGSVVDSTIVSNNAAIRWSYTGYGGGVYLGAAGAFMDRCIISANRVSRPAGSSISGFGGGLAMTNGAIRNCLVSGNESIITAGGAYITGGTFENCTVVRNKGTVNYGGVFWTNTPAILNDIVYDNSGGVESNILPVVAGLTNVTYSCAPSLSAGTGNITSDPLFTDSGSGSGITFTAGDYRLVRGASPCRNKGYAEDWMQTATDLDRLPRIKARKVDMGCYEDPTSDGSLYSFF